MGIACDAMTFAPLREEKKFDLGPAICEIMFDKEVGE